MTLTEQSMELINPRKVLMVFFVGWSTIFLEGAGEVGLGIFQKQNYIIVQVIAQQKLTRQRITQHPPPPVRNNGPSLSWIHCYLGLHDISMSIHLIDETTSQSWQAYETPTGANAPKEIELEEVVKKKRPLGRFMPDGTWDDEDPDARVRRSKQHMLKLTAITCFTVAAYMLMHFLFLGVEAREDVTENVQLGHLGSENDSDSLDRDR